MDEGGREDAEPNEGGREDADPSLSRPERSDDPVVGPRWLRNLSPEDPDPPELVDAIGQFGIYLGVVAIVLAVVGLVAGTFDVQILARMSIFFALVLASVAMGLGVVYQVYVLGS